jgi:ubiquinone/menaquinone biosynthesis C-methylase UbiE
MTERFFKIAEMHQPFSHPLPPEKLLHLATLCGVNAGTRLLDLACGKGELLVQWARAYDLQGTGVDEDETLIDAAHQRANELEVWSQLQFVESDVLDFPQPFHQYNIVSCLSATWLETDKALLIATLREALKTTRGGLLLIGETFWQKAPPPEVCAAMGIGRDDLPLLGELVGQFFSADVQLLNMLLATTEDRDGFYSQQWQAVHQWIQQQPEHEDVPALRDWVQQNQQHYLQYEREYLGWGVFILHAEGTARIAQEDAEYDDDLSFD